MAPDFNFPRPNSSDHNDAIGSNEQVYGTKLVFFFFYAYSMSGPLLAASRWVENGNGL